MLVKQSSGSQEAQRLVEDGYTDNNHNNLKAIRGMYEVVGSQRINIRPH